MKFRFSEDIWEKISLLWDKERRQEAEEPDYSDKQVKELMKTLFLVRRACKPGKKQTYDMRQAWSNVVSRTKQRNTRKLVTWVFKYAAVLAVVICCAVLWMNQGNKNDHSITAEVDSISSGTRKAELILADGKSVVLDLDTNVHEMEISGMKFMNDDKNGELRYDGSFVAGDSSQMSYNILCIPKGGEYSLQLPDGSRIWLNSETSIRFPVCFMKDRREVYLSGEAYFEVAKDVSAPFHVYVKGGEVTVLGTSFNISAYKEDVAWQTTLVSGRVQVEADDRMVVMKPTEQYSVDRHTGEGVLKEVDTELYTSWVDGKFYFNAYAFEDIVKKLERWYDFTMNYQDEEIKRMHFSGTINKHRPLNEVLQFLEKTTDIHFEISGKNITVSKIKKG